MWQGKPRDVGQVVGMTQMWDVTNKYSHAEIQQPNSKLCSIIMEFFVNKKFLQENHRDCEWESFEHSADSMSETTSAGK